MRMTLFLMQFFTLCFILNSVFSERIQIQINLKKRFSGKTFYLELDTNDTVKKLKKQIQKKEGISAGRLKLFLPERYKNGKTYLMRLKDKYTLDQYDIRNGDVLELFLQKENRTGRIKINFEMERDFLRNRFTLNVRDSDTIEELKREIVSGLRDHMDNLEFFVHNDLQHDAIGYLWDGKKTIADYGIRNGDTVHVRDESEAPPTMPRGQPPSTTISHGNVISGGMQILIHRKRQDDFAKTFDLNVEKEATVKSVKLQIQEREGFQVWQQKLMYLARDENYPERLKDEDTLAKYYIRDGDELELVLHPQKRTCGRRIEIKFKVQKNFLPNQFSLRIKESDSIEELKKQIVLELKNQMDNLAIYVHDELQHDVIGYLSDGKKTIARYGSRIKNGDTVHVRDGSQAPPTMPRNYAGPLHPPY